MRWTPQEGFFLLERHLYRLEQSARYFAFRCRLDEIRASLDRLVIATDRPLRVRLLVGPLGQVRTEAMPLEAVEGAARLGLASRPVDPTDAFLFHKTTNRAQLERERSAAYDEMVLWNPAREVTEAITANIVAEIDGHRVTPPIACGLLGGTLRAELLAAGEIEEARIPLARLRGASGVWLINSVRGWRPARFDPPS